MSWCIGFPYCRSLIDESTQVACRTCWYKIPSRLRNEVKAALFKWGKETNVFKESRKKAEDMLHKRLSFGQRKQDNVRRFTIVPGKTRPT